VLELFSIKLGRGLRPVELTRQGASATRGVTVGFLWTVRRVTTVDRDFRAVLLFGI
jgi:hypothetical protein